MTDRNQVIRFNNNSIKNKDENNTNSKAELNKNSSEYIINLNSKNHSKKMFNIEKSSLLSKQSSLRFMAFNIIKNFSVRKSALTNKDIQSKAKNHISSRNDIISDVLSNNLSNYLSNEIVENSDKVSYNTGSSYDQNKYEIINIKTKKKKTINDKFIHDSNEKNISKFKNIHDKDINSIKSHQQFNDIHVHQIFINNYLINNPILSPHKSNNSLNNSNNNKNNSVHNLNIRKTFSCTYRKNMKNNPVPICLICRNIENPHLKIILLNTKKCQHYICNLCFMDFYNEQMFMGKYDLKCPFFKCNEKFVLEELKNKLSFERYTTLYNNIKKNQFKSESSIDIYKTTNKELVKKHILTMVKGNKFNPMLTEANQLKRKICPKCNEPALYIRYYEVYYICLNCQTPICKFCLKEYTNYHLVKNNENSCKIFFRLSYEKFDNLNEKFRYNFMYIIVSYIVLIIGLTMTESNMIIKTNYRKLNILMKILYIFILMITLVINLCFSLILLPYYPLLINIFD